jgi:hypothetical protein
MSHLPLVPSDLWSPSEQLIHALSRAAYAAAHGDAEAVRTLRLLFGSELIRSANSHEQAAREGRSKADGGGPFAASLPSSKAHARATGGRSRSP